MGEKKVEGKEGDDEYGEVLNEKSRRGSKKTKGKRRKQRIKKEKKKHWTRK